MKRDCVGAVLVVRERRARFWQLRPGFEAESDAYLIQKHPRLVERLQRADDLLGSAEEARSLCTRERGSKVFPSTSSSVPEVRVCNQGRGRDVPLSASTLFFVRRGDRTTAFFNRVAEEIPILRVSSEEEGRRAEHSVLIGRRTSPSDQAVFRLTSEEMGRLLDPSSYGQRVILPVSVGNRRETKGEWTFLNSRPLSPLPSHLPLLPEQATGNGREQRPEPEEPKAILFASVYSLVSLHPDRRWSLFDTLVGLYPDEEERWDRLLFSLGLPGRGVVSNVVPPSGDEDRPNPMSSGSERARTMRRTVRREIVYGEEGDILSRTTDGVEEEDASSLPRRRDFFLPSSRKESGYLRSLTPKTALSWFEAHSSSVRSTSELLYRQMRDLVTRLYDTLGDGDGEVEGGGGGGGGGEVVLALDRLRSVYDRLSAGVWNRPLPTPSQTRFLLPLPDDAVRILVLERARQGGRGGIAGIAVLVDRRYPEAGRAAGYEGEDGVRMPTVEIADERVILTGEEEGDEEEGKEVLFDPPLSSRLHFSGFVGRGTSSCLRRVASHVSSLPTSVLLSPPDGERRSLRLFVREAFVPPPTRRVERGRTFEALLPPPSSSSHSSSTSQLRPSLVSSMTREDALLAWDSIRP